MKNIFLKSSISLLFLFLTFLTNVNANEFKYDAFIMEQLKYANELERKKITKSEIDDVLVVQKNSYNKALESMMRNKEKYIANSNSYENEIFALQRIIKINKRAGNNYAVVRDEVQVKSYELLSSLNKMVRDVLLSLENSESEQFSKELHRVVDQHSLFVKKVTDLNYIKYLDVSSNSLALKAAKENIRELYTLLDINADAINYMQLFEQRIFRLNKYSKYNLIGTVINIKNSNFAQTIDPILEPYGIDMIKIILIAVIILFVYMVRKIVFYLIEKNLEDIEALHKYAKDVVKALMKPIDFLVFVININLIMYIYNDFTTVEIFSKVFNITYTGIFTIVVYRIVTAVSIIKVNELETNNTQIKNDVINVGIKMLNFIIIILGFLVILHFSGANLTAVLSGLGIGGLAIALAAKDYLANFFGTLTILFSDVLSQGEWVEVDGQEGVVVEIGTRVTTLRTFDNALIAIPNAMLANKEVKNWNKRSLGRRIKMNLSIKYGSKSSDINNAVNDIRDMLYKHPEIATEHTEHTYEEKISSKLISKDDAEGIKKTLLVYLDEFSDSSIDILVYCFTKSIDWQEWLETKEDVMHKIMAIFERNNLEFAFPSMSIYNETDK